MAVKTERSGDVLTIIIDNPPVNALGHKVRAGLVEAVKQVDADHTIKAVVLTGAGRFFSAGADITEFGKPSVEPTLPAVLEYLEGCRLPIVAALPGAALGGGLEVALACRYRIASPVAKVGLPEVNIGLIPGAGGTQRLPRLVGMKKAAEFITSGKPVDAKAAHKLGIIDVLVTDDLVGEARAYATELTEKEPRTPLSAAQNPDDWDPEWFEGYAKKIAAKARGQLSPVKALEAVKAACTLPFKVGLIREREIFKECHDSEQRGGLIHAFFAERDAAKIPFLKEVKPVQVEAIGILGAGTMGAGIAISCLGAGYGVKLFDTNEDALAKGINRIEKTIMGNVAKGRMSEKEASLALSRLSPAQDLKGLNDVDLVIEAIVEIMDIKKKVFKDLDQIVKPDCILASNTSYLDVDEIAGATSRPENVIGMHFFSPANIMKLLEVIKADKASDVAIATGFAVGKKLGKTSVLSGVCDGFIGNRILKKYRQQAEYMIEDGAMPQDVDRAMRAFGYPMGPFQIADLAGIDIGWHTRRRGDATRDPNERYVDIPDKLYELGRYGQKTGAGYYDYKEGDRTPHPSAMVEELIVKASEEKNIARSALSEEEIQQRLLQAMANEAKIILEEGIALKSSDIDVVLVNGYGFPKYRGGLMYYAEAHNLL